MGVNCNAEIMAIVPGLVKDTWWKKVSHLYEIPACAGMTGLEGY